MNMKLKKTACAALAGIMVLGTAASAKDNIYAYNKFISTVLGPQVGYCNFAASFAGHEKDFDDVNVYFEGLISALYDDIDGDMDNELITVETRGVSVYRAEENGVTFLGASDAELIANFGDSYANVFLTEEGAKKYICVETYGKTINEYHFYMYELNAETDELGKVLEVSRESNEDGTEEKVWARDKTYYSYTNGGGIQSTINPDKYAGCGEAAAAALKNTASAIQINTSLKDRIEGKEAEGDNYRFNNIASGISQKTYIRATGLRFSDNPVVIFEDSSSLGELAKKPDIVTVTLNGDVLQFPTQDPVIVDNRTLVPMRTIFEALGARVDWIDENGTQKIIANTSDKNISMTINSSEFFVNGESRTLDVPAQLMNDKTMVPLRAISESLGCSVEWEQETKTVIIQSEI